VRQGLRELKNREYLENFDLSSDNRVTILKAQHSALKIDVPIFDSRRINPPRNA
jgi:hypothetical protein